MKRAQRHHLKENELQILARQARELLETRQRELTAGAVAVAVVALTAAGYVFWRGRVEARAHAMLADALVVEEARVAAAPAPPTGPASPALAFPTERARSEAALEKLKKAADAYPRTDAGIFARYQEAAVLMSLGRYPEAAGQYDAVIARDGNGIYGQMARLGRGEAYARAGRYEDAINAFKELAQRKEGPLPIDGVLMQLGRTYVEAGKGADARQTFTRLVEEYPESPFVSEARRELDDLKKT
jgi:TolA-binding protein